MNEESIYSLSLVRFGFAVLNFVKGPFGLCIVARQLLQRIGKLLFASFRAQGGAGAMLGYRAVTRSMLKEALVAFAAVAYAGGFDEQTHFST